MVSFAKPSDDGPDTMTTGDTVPDLRFLRPDGSAVALSELAQSRYLLLVFFRHLV